MSGHVRQKNQNADIENSLKDQRFSEQRVDNLQITRMGTDDKNDMFLSNLSKTTNGQGRSRAASAQRKKKDTKKDHNAKNSKDLTGETMDKHMLSQDKKETRSMKNLNLFLKDEGGIPELKLGASMRVDKESDKDLLGSSKKLSVKRSKSSRSFKRSMKSRSSQRSFASKKGKTVHISGQSEMIEGAKDQTSDQALAEDDEPETGKNNDALPNVLVRQETHSDKSPAHIHVDSSEIVKSNQNKIMTSSDSYEGGVDSTREVDVKTAPAKNSLNIE